jgi:hypothetical protein
LLEELGGMARAIYEEEAIKKQIELADPQILLAMLFGVLSAFSALEYLEPKLGFLQLLCSIDNRFPHIPLLRAFSPILGDGSRKRLDRW